jgi:hypothetical protein
MTRLWPSTYSSRQTTHSTCRPVYRFLAIDPETPFSFAGLDEADEHSVLDGIPGATSEVVWDLGRDLDVMVWFADCNKGEVGDEEFGLAICNEVVDDEFDIV